MSIEINALGTMRQCGYGLTAHCIACGHYGPVSLDRLIDRFGPRLSSVDGHQQIVAAIRCCKCRGKALELRLKAPSGFDGGGGHM